MDVLGRDLATQRMLLGQRGVRRGQRLLGGPHGVVDLLGIGRRRRSHEVNV